MIVRGRRSRASSAFAALLGALLTWATTHGVELPPLSDLPNFYEALEPPQPYKTDPFIRMAVALQSLGRLAALDKLHAMARNPQAGGRVIVLSRMLFERRPGSDLRRPMMGAAYFLGGTGYSDWPNEPIEVVDGVPFLVTDGYM